MVSDNNSLIVWHLLSTLGLSPLVDRVVTHEARVAAGDGRITEEGVHRQEDCRKSFVNLCKAR